MLNVLIISFYNSFHDLQTNFFMYEELTMCFLYAASQMTFNPGSTSKLFLFTIVLGLQFFFCFSFFNKYFGSVWNFKTLHTKCSPSTITDTE